MQYNNQQSVATLVYCGVCELIPGPLEKLEIHMVLMAVTFSGCPPDASPHFVPLEMRKASS
jgi:hypothetical protein